jgi:lysozyme inhibitor LprI
MIAPPRHTGSQTRTQRSLEEGAHGHRSEKPDAPAGMTAAEIDEWKNDLIAAQKAWVAFKDADCKGAQTSNIGVAPRGALPFSVANTNIRLPAPRTKGALFGAIGG